jgi:FMN reductase
MAKHALGHLQKQGQKVTFLDLAQLPLPFCGHPEAGNDSNVSIADERVKGAQAMIFATPIYNYGINAVAKNFIELVGGGLEGKVVSFLCAAGGKASYMGIMAFANSLMLDFRCVIVPRFVYANGESFRDGQLNDEATGQRVALLADETARFAAALSKK